jgi:hypothetical protein
MTDRSITYEDFRKCYAIGKQAHKEDLYNGKPYFKAHVQPIVNYFTKHQNWAEACLAAVHDVVEDHGDVYTYDRLCLMGVPDPVRAALRFITKRPDETYTEFIERSMGNDLSWRVKIRDVLQNLSCNPNRRRARKYAAALLLLTVNCPDSVLK